MTLTSVPATDFNLRTLVRSVLEASRSADLGHLADTAFSRIDPADHAEALRQAMRGFVRQVIGEQRADLPAGPPAHVAPSVAATSAKVTAIRDHWQRALRDRLNVGEGSWKFLGDCTADDLLFAAEQRREHAARNRRRAAQLDALRQQLDDHDVATVGDLPAEVLLVSLGRVA